MPDRTNPLPRPAAPPSAEVTTHLEVAPGSFGGISTARMHPGLTLVPPEDQDTLLGLQLTLEYERAVGGMRSVLTFGAMMMQLRERLALTVPTVGIGVHLNTNAHGGHSMPRGPQAKDGGMNGWLDRHAPAVKRQTAQRLEEVAKAVALEYETIVGIKCAKQIGLGALVTTPAEDLPEPLRAKQLELFCFMDGTSQRSWLDKLRPALPRGGDTSHAPKLSPEEKHAQIIAALRADAMTLFESTLALGPAWRVLTDAEIETGAEVLEEKAAELRAWLKTPNSRRPVLDAAKALISSAPQP